MTNLVPFKRWHMAWLQDAGASACGSPAMPLDALMVLEKENSWTLVIDGDPVACGGTVCQWPGRHLAWMYLNPNTGRHMRTITKAVLSKLADVTGRVEMAVRCDFPAGQRWAKMLGFQAETPVMKAYGPEGEDHTGYVKFN